MMAANGIDWGKTTFAGLFEAGSTVGGRATAGGVACRQPVVVVVEAEELESMMDEVGTVLCGVRNSESR